ncbi:hypothetical protein VNI00_012971 [Paramarasmius palmivorus]|uniref:Uncharacterized protein n=1 Tax=Paramarasmius palmivorus TaxID=297713 RepID=A0AAW0C1J4_9AGAR
MFLRALSRIPLRLPLRLAPPHSRARLQPYSHLRTKPTCLPTLTRSFSTTRTNQEQEQRRFGAIDGKPVWMTEHEAQQAIQRAYEIWPALPSTSTASTPNEEDTEWSSDWSSFPDLLVLYAPSPFYLSIPMIEMVVNLRYGIQGQTRGLVFRSLAEDVEEGEEGVEGVSEHQLGEEEEVEAGKEGVLDTPPDESFLFTIHGAEESAVYLLDTNTLQVHQLFSSPTPTSTPTPIKTSQLPELLNTPADSSSTKVTYHPLPIHPEGDALVQRIFASDPSVREELADDRWLGYMPAYAPPTLGTEVEAEGVEMEKEEEKELVEEARAEGLTSDIDALEEMIKESETLAQEISSSDSSSSVPEAEPEDPQPTTPLSDDPLVAQAVESILSGGGVPDVNFLRTLSVEQLAEVQRRLEVELDGR